MLNDSNFDSRKFVIRFIDLLVKDAEQEYERMESSRRKKQNDKQKILDEISKDKALDISFEDWETTTSSCL